MPCDASFDSRDLCSRGRARVSSSKCKHTRLVYEVTTLFRLLGLRDTEVEAVRNGYYIKDEDRGLELNPRACAGQRDQELCSTSSKENRRSMVGCSQDESLVRVSMAPSPLLGIIVFGLHTLSPTLVSFFTLNM